MNGTEVSTAHLYLLRVMYALISFAMGSMIWPLVFHHGHWSVMHSVAISMLAALSAVCALGIRYPLQMLPMLFFELAWKTIWLVAIALPLWRANQLDAETMQTVRDCIVVVVIHPSVALHLGALRDEAGRQMGTSFEDYGVSRASFRLIL